MKCNPLRWLWGLPLLAMWFWITAESERAPINDDLRLRAQSALQAAGQDWARTGFDGRDGFIRGRAASPEEQVKAKEIVRDVWGVRLVNDETDLLGEIKKYVWSARYNDAGVALSGFVPNERVKTSVIRAVKAKFPNVDVDDKLELARGGPDLEPWLGGISFGLDQLSQLNSGSLDLNGLELSLSGLAPSYTVYKTVRTALDSKRPGGVDLGQKNVSPPNVSPYTWNAVRSSNQLVISGHVPGEQAREQLFEHAKAKFPKLAIVDRMETAAGAKSGWSRATMAIVGQLAALKEGEASMSDGALSVRGRARDEETADRVKAVLERDIPDGFSVDVKLTFPAPKPPNITPFVTSIDVDASRVRIFGYVGSDARKAALIAAVKKQFPDREIVDDLQLGSGEPQSWHTCLMAGLGGIERLGAGRLKLSDATIAVFGETQDESIVAALPGDVRAAANRACESRVEVKLNLPPEPVLNWTATHDGGGQVVLEGEVPDALTKVSLMEAATKLFSDAQIVDRMRVVPGFGKKWRSVAQVGLSQLGKLRKGKASISGADLLVTGEARDTAIATAVKGKLKTAVVRGYSGRGELSVKSDAMIWAESEALGREEEKAAAEEKARREAQEAVRLKAQQDAEARRREDEEAKRKSDEEVRARSEVQRSAAVELEAKRRAAVEARRLAALDARTRVQESEHRKKAEACRDSMRDTVESGVILFEFASSRLNRKSRPTLDQLVELANACPEFTIEVGGHTDAEGAPERNMALSERRARAVVEYLIRTGVSASRLVAVGYGETRPVVSNDTAANRAKNRRIEFDVR